MDQAKRVFSVVQKREKWGFEIRKDLRAKGLKFWPKEGVEFFPGRSDSHTHWYSRKSMGLGIRETKVQILTLSLISCGTLGELT